MNVENITLYMCAGTQWYYRVSMGLQGRSVERWLNILMGYFFAVFSFPLFNSGILTRVVVMIFSETWKKTYYIRRFLSSAHTNPFSTIPKRINTTELSNDFREYTIYLYISFFEVIFYMLNQAICSYILEFKT